MDNQRFAKKLLDAIKVCERPDLNQHKKMKADVNMGIRNMILNYHKGRQSQATTNRATAARRMSHLIP